jgi:hypothetical protein
MGKLGIVQQEREEMFLLSKRMKPEERLVAYFHHSQLMYQMYQAGVKYRKAHKKP